jgi:glycosyltransferase involved in cell wall biosynthesis
MKISIVTISYNQGRFLERTIRSVIEQNYDDIEYIIVDAGSTDSSREIIEKYRDHIAHIIFEPDDGPADGLNKGFAMASGDILGYINADDAYLPNIFPSVSQAFKQYEDVDVIYGHGYIVDGEGTPIRHLRSDPFNLTRFAYRGVVVCQQSTFFRQAAYQSVKGFNKNNRTSWDAELLIDMALAGNKFQLIDDYWSIFSIYEASISGSQRMKEISIKNRARLFQKIMGYPPNKLDKSRLIQARLEKWLLNPKGVMWRLYERIRGKADFIEPDILNYIHLTKKT